MMIFRFRLFLVVVVATGTYYCSGSAVVDHQDETNENLLNEMLTLSQQQPQQSLRGGGRETIEEEERQLSLWSTHPRNCPVIKCAAPCLDDTCGPDERCRTKTRSTWIRGQRCPGCPVFDKCIRKKQVDVCLALPCANPCGICQDNESCKTKPTFFTGPNGQKCPGCPKFVACEPIPSSIQCGPTTCGDGLVCCNASCGICTPPGFACTQQACIDDPTPIPCGSATCRDGLVCCNASCGICTPPDGACTQQVCDSVSYNSNGGY